MPALRRSSSRHGDQVILLPVGGRRSLLNAGASQPRLHLTQQLRDNPAQPPMFCMLLRKHLAGGRLLRLEQEPLERVVALTTGRWTSWGSRAIIA